MESIPRFVVEPIHILMLSILVFYLGLLFNRKFEFLSDFFKPPAVTGRLIPLSMSFRLTSVCRVKYRMITVIFIASCLLMSFASSNAHGDVAQWNEYMKKGQLAYQQGRYAEARTQLLAALKEAEAFSSTDRRLGSTLNNLAEVNRATGRYTEAEDLYRRALKNYLKAVGPDHAWTMAILNNLGVLYEKMGRYSDAELLYKRLLATIIRTLGLEHPQVATALTNLAQIYSLQDRLHDAESLSQRSLAIQLRVLGTEHPNVAVNLSNLASIYLKQRNYDKAEFLYNRSLLILTKQLGSNNMFVAASLNGLGAVYLAQESYAKAKIVLMKSLKIMEQNIGTEHPIPRLF